MKLLLATGNKNKILEFKRIFAPLGVEIISPEDVGAMSDAEETGSTFAENAAIKAEAMHRLTGLPVVADDSGLCVDALGGRPGVRSSRYLGDTPQSEKNLALLRELEGVPDEKRAACFVCGICCIIDKNTRITAKGVCKGKIAYSPSGDGGFGYDPIFLIDGKSFAELSGGEKDSISHRGLALKQFAEQLGQYLERKGEQM